MWSSCHLMLFFNVKNFGQLYSIWLSAQHCLFILDLPSHLKNKASRLYVHSKCCSSKMKLFPRNLVIWTSILVARVMWASQKCLAAAFNAWSYWLLVTGRRFNSFYWGTSCNGQKKLQLTPKPYVQGLVTRNLFKIALHCVIDCELQKRIAIIFMVTSAWSDTCWSWHFRLQIFFYLKAITKLPSLILNRSYRMLLLSL